MPMDKGKENNVPYWPLDLNFKTVFLLTGLLSLKVFQLGLLDLRLRT